MDSPHRGTAGKSRNFIQTWISQRLASSEIDKTLLLALQNSLTGPLKDQLDVEKFRELLKTLKPEQLEE